MTTVIGLDLSLTSAGISNGYDTWRATSKPKKTPTLRDRTQRIRVHVDNILSDRVLEPTPDLVVVEGPSFGSTGNALHQLGGLWWLTIDDLIGRGLTVAEVPPPTLKIYATGKGNAGKDEVLAAVIRRYPDVLVAGNDEADALVLAMMGYRHLGVALDDLPKTHLRAIDSVHWPVI